MKSLWLFISFFVGISLSLSEVAQAQTTATIGAGTSSSSTRGPFQRADTNSSTVFSRFVHVYTASELANAGLTNGVDITALNWELASSNVIIGSGDATLQVYVKNSSATAATADTWANLITGSTLAVDNSYNTTNNFPGANGWMPFAFTAPFTYTGGALEIAVDWDCSQVSTPAFSGDGAIKFRWESTAPDSLVVKRTASSSAPTSITDIKNERANIQIEFMAASCNPPTALNVNNTTATSADLSWVASAGASMYNWKVVLAGAGSGAPAIDGGTTANTTAMATGLVAFTPYDLFVEADCGMTGTSGFAGPYGFLTMPTSVSTITIGTGTSSSSARGPLQRADTNSSTVYSRFVHVYTASELASAGMSNGLMLSALNWELASSNVMVGNGDAALKVYIKNSSATQATADQWANLISGSELVVDQLYNTTNNFPGANGWMSFDFSTPFTYTGGSIEIAVDWDCSQVSTPAFSGDGSLKWRWESTDPDSLVVKRTSSSAPSSDITDLQTDRANIQFAFATPICDLPLSLNASNITSSSSDFSWVDSLASTYNWRVVLAGAGVNSTAVDSGTTAINTASTTMLAAATSYDLYVEADCGSISSDFAGPRTFTTQCATTPPTVITTAVSAVSCNGGSDASIDLTVTEGIPPYSFSWDNADTTEDISGLTAGTYLVTILDGNGCPYFDSVSVAEPTALMLTTSSVSDSANTGVGSASVMVTGGTLPYSYAWNGTPGSADTTGLTLGSYMVSVTDGNGCIDSASVMIEDVVGLSPIDYVASLSIAPNPTSGMAHLAVELYENAEIAVSIFSIRGELIESVKQSNVSRLSHQIDLSTYADGIYFVRLRVNEQTISKKMILNR